MNSATGSMGESQQNSNTNNSADDAEDAASGLSGASAFAAALAAEIGDDESGDADEGTEPAKGGKSQPLPDSLDALAERLGVDVAKLYDIKVPASGGREAMTLGKIKDRFASWDSLEADRLAFSEDRVAKESELTRARQEFQELLSMIPRDKLLNPEVMQRVAQRVTEKNKQLDTQVLTVIPEWKNQEVQTVERKAITELLSGYGLTPGEVAQIRSPGLVKFLRDAMRREQQVRKALEAVKKVAKKPAQQGAARGAPSRSGPTPPRIQAGKPTSERDRFSAALHNDR